ncbi:MAG: metal ABC transporter permease [Flammeovirgaceae bacterium]
MDAFWIIITGFLVASCGGLLGSFLLLRKMTMIGDAISHAILPGIVIAYLISDSRSSIPMLIGAATFGVFSTILIEFFHQKGKLQEDAAIGISFTWLFAIGVILITYFADSVDLDQDCVLYGEIAYTPLDTWIFANNSLSVPKATLILFLNFIVILIYLILGYKGLVLSSFDELCAKASGISTVFWHYSLMSLVSLTTVFSFESVGAILVVAFLVVPAATAFLLTHNLKKMLLYSVLIGLLSSICGYYLAVILDGSIAGAMASTTGIFFVLALLFSPKNGLITRKIIAKNQE